MTFSSAWLLFLGVPLLQASENTSLKMTIQHGAAGNLTEQTIYLQADRKRMEFHNSFGRVGPDRSLQQVSGPRLVAITRCDLGQHFELNLDTSEYTVSSYPPKPLTPEQIKARGLQTAFAYLSDKPTLRIEITTDDTGERKEMFGYSARHVITTTKQIPLEGSHSAPQESITDGWYIDSPGIDPNQRLSCDGNQAAGKKSYSFASLSGGNGNRPRERPEFVTTGERETGFALYSVTTSKNSYTLPDGTQKHSDSKFETKVTEFKKGPLDPALFEIPAGFKQVESIERNPPAAALASQTRDFWQRFKDSVAGLFSR